MPDKDPEFIALPCTRQAIEDYHARRFGSSGGTRYPDQWYADKNNRCAGRPTGHLRCLVTRGAAMVWVNYADDLVGGVLVTSDDELYRKSHKS